MNSPTNVVEAQLQHLLGVVEDYRQRRCAEALDQAHGQAQQLIKQAYHDARLHMHQEILNIREEMRKQLASAKAQQQTRSRQLQQQADQELLNHAWQSLRDTLINRWQQRTSRQEWIEELLDQALVTLVDTHWRIEHPLDWPEQERLALKKRLQRNGIRVTTFQAQNTIDAGLRICTAGTCVDGTAAGLLRDRSYIDALLLARINVHRRA